MKTQLASLALACSLVACGTETTANTVADGPPDGAALFTSQQCKMCHGGDGTGLPGMGPTVVGVAGNWTRESLADYLADPAAVAQTIPRLAESTTNYRMPMPKCGLDREALLALSDHVLAMK